MTKLECFQVMSHKIDCSSFSLFTGLEPAAFAALVPNSAEKVLCEVIEEIMGDHEMLVSSDFY